MCSSDLSRLGMPRPGDELGLTPVFVGSTILLVVCRVSGLRSATPFDVLLPSLLLATWFDRLTHGAATLAADTPETLRIGYQKSSTLMIWLKSRQVLEQALAPRKVNVQWHEFTSGLPLLESLNVGNLDLTADVADAVPPFALAAGASMTYYAIESPSPTAQAIVVRHDSSIR